MTLDSPSDDEGSGPLRRSTTQSGRLSMLVWSVGMVGAISLNFLDGIVPSVVLGLLAFSVVASALVAAVVVHRRANGSSTRWTVHFRPNLVTLEDRRTGARIHLTAENTRRGCFSFTPARGPRRWTPTIVIGTTPPLVVGAPPGVSEDAEHGAPTGLPSYEVDHATWGALVGATRR